MSYEQIMNSFKLRDIARVREHMFGDVDNEDLTPSNAVTRDAKLMENLWTIVNNLMRMTKFTGEDRPMNSVPFNLFSQYPDTYIDIINEMIESVNEN